MVGFTTLIVVLKSGGPHDHPQNVVLIGNHWFGGPPFRETVICGYNQACRLNYATNKQTNKTKQKHNVNKQRFGINLHNPINLLETFFIGISSTPRRNGKSPIYSMSFPFKPAFIVGFPMPCLITERYPLMKVEDVQLMPGGQNDGAPSAHQHTLSAHFLGNRSHTDRQPNE